MSKYELNSHHTHYTQRTSSTSHEGGGKFLQLEDLAGEHEVALTVKLDTHNSQGTILQYQVLPMQYTQYHLSQLYVSASEIHATDHKIPNSDDSLSYPISVFNAHSVYNQNANDIAFIPVNDDARKREIQHTNRPLCYWPSMLKRNANTNQLHRKPDL